MIFDLDPDVDLAWERVVAGALAVRDLLAEMGLRDFAKATGGKGLHVVLPLRPKYGWDAIKSFAHGIADELVRRHPDAYTGSLPKKARRGKIFIDYLRNQRGATAIAPFSSRAKPGAPVAAPLDLGGGRERHALRRLHHRDPARPPRPPAPGPLVGACHAEADPPGQAHAGAALRVRA